MTVQREFVNRCVDYFNGEIVSICQDLETLAVKSIEKSEVIFHFDGLHPFTDFRNFGVEDTKAIMNFLPLKLCSLHLFPTRFSSNYQSTCCLVDYLFEVMARRR